MESKKNEVIKSSTVYTRMGERAPGNEERLYVLIPQIEGEIG